MKKIYSLVTMLLLSLSIMAQCPKIASAMIDACNGTSYEGDNEFMMLTNGNSDILPSQLRVYYATTYPPSAATTKNSFINLTSDYSPAMIDYIESLNVEAASTGCSDLFATSVPTSGIPANATFIIFSPFVTQVYNLNAYCNKKPIYVLVDTAYGSSTCGGASGTSGIGFNRCGTFKNDGSSSANNRRYFGVSTTTGCTEDSVSYDYTRLGPLSSAVDGGFVNWINATASYSNGGCGQIILPVKLTLFNAIYIDDSQVKINWQSMEEINTKKFIVEVSSDAQNFSQVGEIPSKNTNSTLSNYDFTYAPNNNGILYFRLQIVDLDGKVSFSKIVKAGQHNSTVKNLSIHPSPAINQLTVNWVSNIAASTQFSIIDNLGKIVLQDRILSNEGNNSKKIQISMLTSGQYYLLLNTGSETLRSKFLKIN